MINRESRGSDSNRRVLADPDYKSGAVNHCATPAACGAYYSKNSFAIEVASFAAIISLLSAIGCLIFELVRFAHG